MAEKIEKEKNKALTKTPPEFAVKKYASYNNSSNLKPESIRV